MASNRNFYVVLGVQKNASEDEIKKAFFWTPRTT